MPIRILLVEDNLAHQRITEYALKQSGVAIRLNVVHDGQQALDYLGRRDAYADDEKYPVPDLILLDLNLPKRDGREVLRLIKTDHDLESIPVVIVSTSDREEDVSYAFKLGAVAYVSKSSGFDKFNEQIAAIHKFARTS